MIWRVMKLTISLMIIVAVLVAFWFYQDYKAYQKATMSNIFIVNNQKLLTPDLTQCGVAGIMRSVVMDIATAQAIDCGVCSITYEEVCNAEEVFLCNSQFGIWPVREIKAEASFQPGRITQQLQEAIKQEQLTDSAAAWYV